MKISTAIVCAAVCTLGAQQQPPRQPPEPCKDAQKHPEYRQLDFWVGNWDVFAGTEKVGESRVELILKNCVVLENWTGAGGGAGKSFNSYSPLLKKWQQYWVADTGSTAYFIGEASEGEMAYITEGRNQAAEPVTRKMTFTRLPDGKVRQFCRSSTDGKTWVTEYDFTYARKKN